MSGKSCLFPIVLVSLLDVEGLGVAVDNRLQMSSLRRLAVTYGNDIVTGFVKRQLVAQ